MAMDCASCEWTGPHTKTEAHRRQTGHSLYYDTRQLKAPSNFWEEE